MSQHHSTNPGAVAAEDCEAPALCRKLRTKRVDGNGADGEMWESAADTTSSYTCLSTMEVFGPDDRVCHPGDCGESRSCYQPADGAPPRGSQNFV